LLNFEPENGLSSFCNSLCKVCEVKGANVHVRFRAGSKARDAREAPKYKLFCVTDAAERLRRRYPRSRMPRPLLVGLISVAVVLALTWLIWTALRHSRPDVAAQVVSFQIISDSSVAATVSVERRDPTVPVTCQVLAQAADHQPVGEQQVPVAASSERLVEVNLVLTTLRRATTVVIRGCTVT
jgi:Domain of unknown function (DUF4307)